MRDDDLRAVLLVKAIEESDREGLVLPPADRAAAAREALREAGTPPASPAADGGGAVLDGKDQRLLAARARVLLARVVARHAFVGKVMAMLGPSPAVGLGLVVLGLVAGGALASLDGSHRINVLAFPLLGVVGWNVAVYVVLLVLALRRGGTRATPMRIAMASLGHGIARRLIARSRAFNAPLADALKAFAAEWLDSARALLMARAARSLHFAAAALGAGLIAGLYVRGIAFDYRAGWESTFLDAPAARTVLALLYGPASWITGIPVPDAAQLEAMRWRDGAGGESARRWIHLMAASALVYVVIPRVLLGLAAAFAAMRLALRAPLPASLPAYFGSSFSGVDGVVRRAKAIVMPYAAELSPGALAKLIAWITATGGGNVEVEARDTVPYGEEERYLESLGPRGGNEADMIVLPFSLASTPEVENHGAILAGVRDWILDSRIKARLLVVLDEAPYAERMAHSPERLAERREVWRRFVEAYGQEPSFVRLAP
ncbi:MAG TPA: DUF2868 domain-containing protein [Usitatibacter sp.]|nr:DUF2868 domain-containing protein [Usitatibacter sp.]